MTDQANLLVELDLENDGRWIAEVPAIAGALAYGATKDEAERKASGGRGEGKPLTSRLGRSERRSTH